MHYSPPVPRRWPHLLVLLPGLGLGIVFVAMLRAREETDRLALRAAAGWQALAFSIWVVHAVLQAGIEFVSWLFGRVPVDYAVPWVVQYMPRILLLLTVVNVGAGLVEWGYTVWAGVRAAQGEPYPVGRRGR